MKQKSTRVARLARLSLLLVALSGCDSGSETPSAEPLSSAAPEYIYMGVQDDDAPFVDYEGDGMMLEGSTRRSGGDDRYEVELVAADIDPGAEMYVIGDDVSDRLLVHLEGEVTRSGKDGIRVRGSLETRRPARIQFVQMVADGDGSGETFPELAFEPGRHDFSFDATVVGWLEQ